MTEIEEDKFYYSYEEWETETFPRQSEREKYEALRKDPEALAEFIADRILSTIDLKRLLETKK